MPFCILSHMATCLSISCKNMIYRKDMSACLSKICYNHICLHALLYNICTFLARCSAGLSRALCWVISAQCAVPLIRMTLSLSTILSFQVTLSSVHGSMLPWWEKVTHLYGSDHCVKVFNFDFERLFRKPRCLCELLIVITRCSPLT